VNYYWIFLILAGLSEIGWTISLKFSEDFSKPLPTAIAIFFIVSSIVLLTFALKRIPIGIAYAIWVSIGIIGVAIAGMLVFGESRSMLKIGFLAMILIGVVGLKLITD